MRKILVFAAIAALPAFAVFAEAGPPGQAAPACLPGLADPFGDVSCATLSEAELAAALGGDVYLELNEARTRLKVTVTSTDPEAKLGLVPRKEVFEIDAHNRVQDTTKAPFMPTRASEKQLPGADGYTSRPAAFPGGSWAVGDVVARDDKYGPNWVRTNAVGQVEVFGRDGARVGVYEDTGYAIHSNSGKAFGESSTWGCVLVKEDGNQRIAEAIRSDRICGGRKQVLTVRAERLVERASSRAAIESSRIARRFGRDL